MVSDLAKSVMLYAERGVKYISDVVVPIRRGERGREGGWIEGRRRRGGG